MRHRALKRFNDRVKTEKKLKILKNKIPSYLAELQEHELKTLCGKLVKNNVDSIYTVKKKNRGLPHSITKQLLEYNYEEDSRFNH